MTKQTEYLGRPQKREIQKMELKIYTYIYIYIYAMLYGHGHGHRDTAIFEK